MRFVLLTKNRSFREYSYMYLVSMWRLSHAPSCCWSGLIGGHFEPAGQDEWEGRVEENHCILINALSIDHPIKTDKQTNVNILSLYIVWPLGQCWVVKIITISVHAQVIAARERGQRDLADGVQVGGLLH